MAKKRTEAKKRVTRKPPSTRRQRRSPDTIINTLVILVVIVMVLGGLFLYAQNNKKQAALLQSLIQTIGSLPTPAPTALPAEAMPQSQEIAPATGLDPPLDPPKDLSKPAAALSPAPPAAMAVVRSPSQNN